MCKTLIISNFVTGTLLSSITPGKCPSAKNLCRTASENQLHYRTRARRGLFAVYFTTGLPAFCQASMPPSRLSTL